MRSCVGDNANIYTPLHPNRNEVGTMSYVPRNFTKFSGNALYWILQVSFQTLFHNQQFSIYPLTYIHILACFTCNKHINQHPL